MTLFNRRLPEKIAGLMRDLLWAKKAVQKPLIRTADTTSGQRHNVRGCEKLRGVDSARDHGALPYV